MSHVPDIPGHEHVISQIEDTDGVLTIRLVSDIHPGTEADAYLLKAHSVRNPDQVRQFLGRMKDAGEYLYARWRGTDLALAAEYEEEFLIEAEKFEVTAVELSAAELSGAMQRVYSWYLAENESGRRMHAKLQQVRDLLTDQMRRVSTKAAAHPPDSSVGVLYAQQLAFIHRLLSETEV